MSGHSKNRDGCKNVVKNRKRIKWKDLNYFNDGDASDDDMEDSDSKPKTNSIAHSCIRSSLMTNQRRNHEKGIKCKA